MNQTGALVISLDFELLWGVIDIFGPDDYGKTHVKGVGVVIPRLIALFEKYGVKATVGFVGMILYPDKEHLLQDLPLSGPSYKNEAMSPYENAYINNIRKADESLYFAPKLIEILIKSPNIELGSHTFCHYYCNEVGQNVDEFEADIKKVVEQAKEYGLELKSIIFPRNQVRDEYLQVCMKYGFQTYRGNPPHFFSKKRFAIWNKVGRFLDTYLPLTKTTYPYTDVAMTGGMANVMASRFFRPFSPKLASLEWLKICRIKQELKRAAKYNEVYHLWWHPHNFGANLEDNMRQLEIVLKTFKKCSEKYGMASYTMSEMNAKVKTMAWKNCTQKY